MIKKVLIYKIMVNEAIIANKAIINKTTMTNEAKNNIDIYRISKWIIGYNVINVQKRRKILLFKRIIHWVY